MPKGYTKYEWEQLSKWRGPVGGVVIVVMLILVSLWSLGVF